VSGVLDPATPAGSLPPRPRPGAILAFVAGALGTGAVAGVLWWWAVDLPGYQVNREGVASTSERGLADFIAGDAWFTVLGAVAGLGLGWLAWTRLRHLGWSVVLVAAGSAVVAALVCWLVGHQLGPDDFTRRLAAARPGDVVPIQLTIRAKASLLVWPFAATVPVLLGSSLGRDDEEPRPRSHEPLFRLDSLKRPVLGRRRVRPEPK
jgi:hypothetical protein